MTVEPGFGGQKLIMSSAQKIVDLRLEIARQGLNTSIEVDGGVNAENAEMLKQMGADILVAGSFVFNAADKKSAIQSLR